ncbi:MAG: hypothetical protein Q8J69_07800 [Sphingobacteriaceae bacterium]|nr:hypothetical protein [Sphingobacteriaceae bacterium]
MQAFTIEHKGRVYQGHIPESFNELTADQLLQLCRYYNGQTLLPKARLHFLLHLLGWKPYAWRRNRALMAVPAQQLHFLSQALNWAFAPSTLTRQLLPRVRVGLRFFYGPKDFFGNGIFDEVVTAIGKSISYKKAEYEADRDRLLAELAATMYRPRKWYWPLISLLPWLNNGDQRQKFNEHLIKPNAKLLSKLPKEQLHAILLFFEGCQAHWKAVAPDAFTSTEGSSDDKFGWEKFYVAMAGPKFGNIHQVGNTYYTNILIHLQSELENKPKK